jgi:hypothetical protein
MPQSILLELVRQVLRWSTLWLIAKGLPEPIAVVFDNPDFAAQIAASITLSLADGGWLVVKAKQFRAWLRAKFIRTPE